MKNASLYIDLAFCLGFLPLMIFAFPVERWWGTYPVFFCSFVGWLYATYFSYKYFIVPRLFHKGRPRMYALTAIAVSLLVTFLFSSYEISSPFYHVRQQLAAIPVPSWGARQNQQAIWLHYIIVVIFCFAVGMLTEAYRQRLAREEVEYERNKAELALYKAQINPHFLFNTLNALYGLLITRSDKTEATLERFINLTKYMYNNANRDFIPLGEEVEYIDQYILAAERIRRGPLRPHGRARRDVSAAHAADYVRGKCVQVRHFVQRTLLRPYPTPPAGLHAPFRSGKLRFRAGVAKLETHGHRQLP